ncbi:alpha/beta fold hydrolase [Bacillus mojavensis]|uniref:alpha/beta fold hydrolase n=1 Tax=Bacillus mojavensis TaxID=72360 RepID=UPI002DBAD6B4|nr:alpha/beta hydrolase [Bacillus mojavensis]MEC1292339.1 alpha/beta hydrolase [Bacillus mojavensis]MEC1614295.1 alpha/beta hydrolase [Bacillus mojavensis]MEC1620262.1 alpha/beta hydrolase [Bacillus mojavensis]MEC1634708.1 alpha/beta hydrolase [Bacillus mojavensis]MEC1657965.1 alpha/beta hydrolase [Bacillus mojavensis]
MEAVTPIRRVKVGGVNVYYEHYQNPGKQTIVCVHGFLSSAFSFRKLIPLLRDQYDIIALDLPPFGQSEKSRTFRYTYQNLAMLIIGLLEHLQVKQAALVGHSMGGQISLSAALLKPELFSKIVLLCSSGYLKRSHPTIIFGTHLPYFHLYIKRWLSKEGVMKNLLNVVHNKSLIDEEMIDGYGKPFQDEQIFKAMTKFIRHREGDLQSEELKKMNKPALLIWGEEDKVVPVKIGERLHHDLPDSKLYSLRETGHLVPEERPEFVSERIAEFITE